MICKQEYFFKGTSQQLAIENVPSANVAPFRISSSLSCPGNFPRLEYP